MCLHTLLLLDSWLSAGSELGGGVHTTLRVKSGALVIDHLLLLRGRLLRLRSCGVLLLLTHSRLHIEIIYSWIPAHLAYTRGVISCSQLLLLDGDELRL